jgi:RNA polymerase sigma-70 factor (ECF subfamily)
MRPARLVASPLAELIRSGEGRVGSPGMPGDKDAQGPTQGLRQLGDEELMLLVAQGRAEAFEMIYERHGTAAFSLAYRMCGNRSAAEDIVQEAFLSMWRSGSRYDRMRGSVRTWTLGIVHNRAIDSLRRSVVHDRRRASDEGLEERFEAHESTEVEVARRDEARSIRTILDGLPAEQCKVIELAYFGGFTHTEIADMLDTPVGTVKGRMRLGLEKMRGVLTAQGATP